MKKKINWLFLLGRMIDSPPTARGHLPCKNPKSSRYYLRAVRLRMKAREKYLQRRPKQQYDFDFRNGVFY